MVATTVIVASPIVDMALLPAPGINHASLNVPFLMGVVMAEGDGVNLVFDFGDGSPVITKPRLGKCWGKGYLFNYSLPGMILYNAV